MYMCESKQKTKEDLIDSMERPHTIIPLDRVIDDNMTEFMVGFPNVSVLHTELKQSAFFQGSKKSYIDYNNIARFSTENGLSIGLWIKGIGQSIKPQTLMDFRRSPLNNGLTIYIENDFINVRICNDEKCTTEILLTSHTGITPESWTFVAFTFNTLTNAGTFFVNHTYGIKNEESGYFEIGSNDWFISKDKLSSLRIGGSVMDDSAFLGEISCLQLYNKTLNPAQIFQLSQICHVDKSYERSKVCPEGYFLLHKHCYRASQAPMTYVDAQLSCLSDPSDSYVTDIAFPENYQIQEIFVAIAKRILNVDQIFVGLDSESGKN